jgi:Amt family ammonium transporter
MNEAEFQDAAFGSCQSLSQACPLLEDILNTNSENEQWKDDATWILTSSFVILTMQSGFGLLEIGSCSSGNEVNTMLKNVADILFGALAFYFVGYGIAYGQPSTPFMGLGDFFPDGQTSENSIDSGVLYSRYLFQLSFAATSATIVSGCIAMRMKFEVYCGFAFYAVVIYSFVAHWVWADDGWLFTRGYHDFAGGSAVHLHGAVNGLIAILFVGPRRGRFDGTRPESDFEESSPTSMLFGLFMLWWGWIGFNCGSTFGISGDKWMVAARAGVNTINASAGGGVTAMIYSKYHSKGKFIRPPDVVNGILGALVASSPTCAAVHTYDSLIIGVIGALLACWVNDTVTKKWFQLDDPVGALGVHAAGGLWGILAVGLFGDGDLPGVDLIANGLFRGGGFELMWVQLLGTLAIATWSVVTMTPFFYFIGVTLSRDLSNPRIGLRHDFDQMDPHLHGCTEDPAEKITTEIAKAFEREHVLERSPAGARNVFAENALQGQGASSNASLVTPNTRGDSDTNEPDEAPMEVEVAPDQDTSDVFSA